MQKPQQVKPKKDKKKNNQTGLLMGQNINIFSQLSATYLTAKSHTTQEQQHFVKETQIIEYHDHNINRIISLLRKKAEVTKAKAVQELKEAVLQMNEQQVDEFMPTYASLYQEIVVNEQAKQVFEEFVQITASIFDKHKKVALKQIATLFPSMLLSFKLSKLNKLLFTGTQQEMNEKAYFLLIKKQVRKKFLLLSNLLLQTDQTHLITQTNYQRNIHQYGKMIKDLLNVFLNHSKRKELSEDTQTLVRDVCELLVGKTPDEYFKAGGKGKASLIEIYSYLVKFASLERNEDIPWKKLAKVVCQHFLDKDATVQSTLWKYCNKQILVSLRQMAINEQRQDEYALFNQNLPKSEQKLVQVLRIGGLAMYKFLPGYLKEHPSFVVTESDGHKSVVQKITFMRKLMVQILGQEDENEARSECYYSTAELLYESMMEVENSKLKGIIEKQGQSIENSKKGKQIKTLIQKLRMELVLNLQKKYYTQPPMSKNYFTYYTPESFCKFLNKHPVTNFTPTFNDKLTFPLYKDLKAESPMLEVIYSSCQQNLSLLLAFYETWQVPGKQLKLDMSQANDEYQKTAKIFFLAHKHQAADKDIWFGKTWDLRKSAIIYDPRLTAQDLETEPTEPTDPLPIHFSPIAKHLPEVYQLPQLNASRFHFFLQLLQDNQIQVPNLKFFLPYLFAHLVTEDNAELLLQRYLAKAKTLKENKWIVGQKQIAFLRIAVRFFNLYLLKQQKTLTQTTMINKFTPYFLSIGAFLKTLNTYKMDKDVLQILKQLNQLLRVPEYESQLLLSLQSILQDIFSLLNKTSSLSSSAQKEQKLRKNRLKRINDFVEESVWYLLKRNSPNFTAILLELFSQKHLWASAESKVEPWAVGFTILSKSGEFTIESVSSQLISHFDQHHTIISLLFSCQFMLPLQIYPEYKKVYMLLQSGLLKQFSSLSVDTQLYHIQQLMIYQFEQGLLTESLGLKNLLNSTLKYYQTFSAGDMLTLGKQIGEVLFSKILAEPQTSHKLHVKSLIAANLLAEIPLQDLSNSLQPVWHNILQILQKQVQNLQSHFTKFLSLCLLSTSLWRTPLGQTTLLKWQQLKVIQNLLNRLVPQLTDIEPLTTYHSYVIFSTINSLYPIFGYELVEANLESVIRVFWERKENERADDMYIFKQEERVKFVNRVFLEVKKDTAHQVIARLPQEALQEYGHYQKFLLQLEEQQDDETTSVQQKSIHNLFIEYSQLLMKITTFLTIGQSKNIPDETVLIELLQCPFAGIKKTTFILLKQLYDLKLVPAAIPEVFKSVLVFRLKPEHDIDDLASANQVYNFLYSWLTLISRRKAIEVASANQQEELTLEDYIQSSGLSQLFLNNVFALIGDKIDFLKYQNEFLLSSEQLLQQDFTLNIEEQSHMSQKLFTLSAKVLFAYAINFPLYLRSFMDKSKKYRSVCEKLLRNYISDAIFAKEVAMIEVREAEWKANGSLEIYVIKKNKEIYAEYQHDVIRIGLRLVMRANYPLTPIHIQFGEGLKMEDGSKWALMLQSQLHNRNNSIINGILLWKENIDKKLSGIEECAICFDIVDPKGHTPKKSCKTCKKKFHSNCIMKWFSKSNKSECPLCKSQFL